MSKILLKQSCLLNLGHFLTNIRVDTVDSNYLTCYIGCQSAAKGEKLKMRSFGLNKDVYGIFR